MLKQYDEQFDFGSYTVNMDAPNRNSEEHFLHSVKWIRCLYCQKNICKDIKFLILSCTDIFCELCARKCLLPDKSLKCLICNKIGSYHVICTKMPDQMKQYLLPPTENLLGLKVFTYQMKQGEIAERIAMQRMTALKNSTNELRAKGKQISNQLVQINLQTKSLENEILKYISPEKLQSLLSAGVNITGENVASLMGNNNLKEQYNRDNFFSPNYNNQHHFGNQDNRLGNRNNCNGNQPTTPRLMQRSNSFSFARPMVETPLFKQISFQRKVVQASSAASHSSSSDGGYTSSRRSDPLTYTQTTASDMYDQHHQQSYPKYFRPNQYSAQRTPSYPPPPPPPPAQFNSTGRSHLCFGRKK